MIKNSIVLLFLVLFIGCGSIKLSNSWKSKDFQNITSKKIVVIAKSPDVEIRKSYEAVITKKLNDLGISAVESYKHFPNLEEKEERTQEEINQILGSFSKEGIEGIILTSLKNTIYQNNTSDSEKLDVPTAYQRKSFFTFKNYADLRELPGLDDLDFDDPVTEMESITYILEALIYDITLEKNEQLVGVNIIEITNPGSGRGVLNKFSKVLSTQFKK